MKGKVKHMKKLLALILSIAQLGIICPAVMAASSADSSEPLLTSTDSLSYSSDTMTDANGELYPFDTLIEPANFQRYGITADPISTIWSVQRISSVGTLGIEGLRFGSRRFDSVQSAKNLMSMTFANDTVNTPAALNAGGYVYESEFMVQVKDNNSHLALSFNGKDANGNAAKIGEIRFAPTITTVDKRANPGAANAVNSSGTTIGNKQTIKITSDTSYDTTGELLFLRAKLDFVNKKFSAWIVPRKSENGPYTPVEPTAENLLVENADMINTLATEFAGISYDLKNFRYGNGVWIKNIGINSYVPEEIVVTPSPVPTPTEGHEEGVALKIAVLSDTQYGRAAQDGSGNNLAYAGKKFKNALRQVVAKAGGINQLDALMIPGDITHNSTAAQYQAFVNDLNEVIPSGSHTKVMFLRGNHDAKTGLQSNFMTYLSKYDPTLTKSNNIYDIFGYKFIMVSQDTERSNDNASSHPYLHSPDTISWFNETVKAASAEAAADGKPVFVAMHPNVRDTVYGSFPVAGMRNGAAYNSSYWATNELYNGLKDCSNAITFSGHSHWDIDNVRSIHQKEFTSLNTGSVCNLEIEDCWDESFQPKRFGSSEKESSGYYMEVSDNNVVTIHKMDFLREREFGEPWVVDVNDKANWQYTDDRDQNPPYFTQDAVATVSDISQSTCKVTFTQGVDDENKVGHYKMELINQETGAADKIFTISSYYWQGDQAPTENYWNVSGLQNGTEYKAVITAYDQFYQASSNKLESDTFRTIEREVIPAALTKVSFTDSGIQDTSDYARFYNLQPRTYGSTPVSYNSDLNMYEAEFKRTDKTTTSPNFFKVMFDDGRKELMQGANGYTIDLMFNPSALNSSNNVIGAAQSSGFDIETTADGTLETYVHHGGKWVTPYPGSSLKVNTNEYYHITVTYDGSVVRVYRDGVEIDSQAASGAMKFFSNVDENFGMVVGGDYNPTGKVGAYTDQTEAQNAFSGKIVFANIYNGALTSKEISALNDKYTARRALTKIDDLNELLTGGTLNDALSEEGWELMADENTTDDDINAFISKAQSGKDVKYSFYANKLNEEYDTTINTSKYGITVDTANTIWSVVKLNSDANCYTDAVRFSARKNIGDKNLMSMSFADDTVHNPDGVKFENGKYILESELQVLYIDDGSIDLTFEGRDESGNKKDFATLRFVSSAGSYKYTGEAYFVDADGNKIGNSVKYKTRQDDTADAASVLYLRMELDMETGTYSASLVPRKIGSSAYTGARVSSNSVLVENNAFNNAVNSLDSMRADITKSALTNILWLNSLDITGTNGDALTYVNADLSLDSDALINSGTTDVTASINNATTDPIDVSLYCAQYNENGVLIKITKTDKNILTGAADNITETISLDENASTVKVFLWNSNMLQLAYALVNK